MTERGPIYWAGFAVVAREALGVKAFVTTTLAALLAAEGRVVRGDRIRSIWCHHAPILKPGTITVGVCLLRAALDDVGFPDAVQTTDGDRGDVAHGYSIDPTIGARIVAWLEARV